jgi:hypothetical protein
MTNIVLRDILFIPDLTKNLISTSQLVNLGCIIQLNHAGATIQHPQQSFPLMITKSMSNMLIVNLRH